ncbi:MAG: hypothetical protein JWM95_3007 [Gemmatimonadetes bacterium]|nr:hypothetical protein [Gemmatimonadota bacterium]
MSQQEQGRILLVDDDQAVLRLYQRVLAPHGWTVETARDGLEARAQIQKHTFDVILSDINMPGSDGVAFLREVRALDLDVPVILATGAPTVDSSVNAIEHGVFRYLIKPITNAELVEVVSRAARLHKLARLKRSALEIAGTGGKWLDDRAALENHFESAKKLLWMAFQPIVSWRDQRVYAYEALLRSDERALGNPVQFIEAAERLGRLDDLGRTIRATVAVSARDLPADVKLFVNLHPSDLADPNLLSADSPLAALAGRVVLEVTERASLEGIKDLAVQISTLKGLGYHIAVDDLGSGYAGLSSFTQLEPEIVKLDISLVRGIDLQTTKQAIVGSMRKLCDELGMDVVAEGVETVAERDTLVGLGCDLFQGYLFARPQRGFAQPVWRG